MFKIFNDVSDWVKLEFFSLRNHKTIRENFHEIMKNDGWEVVGEKYVPWPLPGPPWGTQVKVDVYNHPKHGNDYILFVRGYIDPILNPLLKKAKKKTFAQQNSVPILN